MGPLDKYILQDDALEATKTGFQLKFQSHWYRSLPLSCMDFNLKIDGKEIDNQSIEIEVNNKIFSYNQLLELDKEFLFILDKGKILVPQKLEIGNQYQVEFTLNLYIPYILVGPESKPLLAGTKVVKTLVCKE